MRSASAPGRGHSPNWVTSFTARGRSQNVPRTFPDWAAPDENKKARPRGRFRMPPGFGTCLLQRWICSGYTLPFTRPGRGIPRGQPFLAPGGKSRQQISNPRASSARSTRRTGRCHWEERSEKIPLASVLRGFGRWVCFGVLVRLGARSDAVCDGSFSFSRGVFHDPEGVLLIPGWIGAVPPGRPCRRGSGVSAGLVACSAPSGSSLPSEVISGTNPTRAFCRLSVVLPIRYSSPGIKIVYLHTSLHIFLIC